MGLISPSYLEAQAAGRESSRSPLYSVESKRTLQRGIHPFLRQRAKADGMNRPLKGLSLHRESPPTTVEEPQTTSLNLMPVTSQMRRIPPEVTLSKQCQCHLRMTQLSPLLHHVLYLSVSLVYISQQRMG